MSRTQQAAPAEVLVLYQPLEKDVHVFVLGNLPGLHHAHKDLRRAYDTLETAVNQLARHCFGDAVRYTLDQNFDAFRARLAREPSQVLTMKRQPAPARQAVAG